MKMLEVDEYVDYGVPLLDGMLAYHEEDEFTERHSAVKLKELISSLEPGMTFHCSNIDNQEMDIDSIDSLSDQEVESGDEMDYNELWVRK
jgi:hypothetical protein